MKPEKILSIIDRKDLDIINWQDWARLNAPVTQDQFEHIFKLCDAFWMHDGDTAKPHAELTSGLCSNGFIDCNRALCYSNVCQLMAYEAKRCVNSLWLGNSEWVIGSSYAAIDFSKDIANLLNCKHGFTEKGEGKSQVWQKLTIEAGERVLHVEELMATSLTASEVRKGVESGNRNRVIWLPFIFVLVHRSDVYDVNGVPVEFAYHYDIWAAEPEDCQLCKKGSKRLRPKINWAELTGKV